MIRQPKVARDTARKGRTSAIITLKPLVVNAPADLPRVPRWALESGAHQSLRPISGVCNEQPDSLGEALTESLSTPLAPPRHRGASPTTPCSMTSAPRRRRHCGRHTVSVPTPRRSLLIVFGDNPERIRSEAASWETLRCLPHPGFVRTDQPAPALPRRAPPSQRRSLPTSPNSSWGWCGGGWLDTGMPF